MQQLSITYFYPLTEQIELDLDYTPCLKYEEDKRKNSLYVGNRIDQWSIYPTGTAVVTLSTIMDNPRFTIDVDKTPITIKSLEKPNFIKRYVYKALGMKWESK